MGAHGHEGAIAWILVVALAMLEYLFSKMTKGKYYCFGIPIFIIKTSLPRNFNLPVFPVVIKTQLGAYEIGDIDTGRLYIKERNQGSMFSYPGILHGSIIIGSDACSIVARLDLFLPFVVVALYINASTIIYWVIFIVVTLFSFFYQKMSYRILLINFVSGSQKID